MAKVMGKGDFSTTHSGKTTQPILIKLDRELHPGGHPACKL